MLQLNTCNVRCPIVVMVLRSSLFKIINLKPLNNRFPSGRCPILHKIKSLSRAVCAFHIDPAKGNYTELRLPLNDMYI